MLPAAALLFRQQHVRKAERTYLFSPSKKHVFDDDIVYETGGRDQLRFSYYYDDEASFAERDGSLWNSADPVRASTVRLVVAPTRPETMLGDVAVAVHPDDARGAFFGCNLTPAARRTAPRLRAARRGERCRSLQTWSAFFCFVELNPGG